MIKLKIKNKQITDKTVKLEITFCMRIYQVKWPNLKIEQLMFGQVLTISFMIIISI